MGVAHALLVASDTLSISLELTTRCNMACGYCYEDDLFSRPDASDELVHSVAKYIRGAVAEGSFEAVELSFIGGEPTLALPQLFTAYRLIAETVTVPVSVHVDTNGLRPLSSLYDSIQTLDLVVCMSLPNDHDTFRPSLGGQNTYERVRRNLESMTPRDGLSLGIGYNVHYGNARQFPAFLSSIADLNGRPVDYVMASRLIGYPHTPAFTSAMSATDFAIWRRDVYYGALSSAGWPIQLNLGPSTLCQGHTPYSCKVYSDGRVGICDAMRPSSCHANIWELAENPSLMNLRYAPMKCESPLKNCGDCGLAGLCPGILYCADQCDRFAAESELLGCASALMRGGMVV